MEFEPRVRADVLGARLKAARTLRRITQESAAGSLGYARTTLVAIEAGKRVVGASELRAMVKLYEASEVDLLADSTASVDMQVQFRSSANSRGAEDEILVASMLNRLASSVVQLEALVGATAQRVDMPLVLLSSDESVEAQAEDAALSVRARLGLGLGPVQDLNSILESELGLRVFERPLPSTVSGAMAFSEAVGGFVLLNIKHPPYRRRVTAAHELGHAILRKTGVTVHFEADTYEDREEQFCDTFGSCFLMPAAAVRKKAAELKRLVGKFTVKELLTLTLYFNVSMEALIRRMVALKLLPRGTFERLKADGLSLKHQAVVREELGLSPEPANFTARSLLLAMAAHRRELLTEQQISSMLELDLLTVRTALAEGDSGQEESLDLVS